MNTANHSSRLPGFRFLCAVVVIAGMFLFFYRLDARDLWSSHEARAAQDAQTILKTGDWLVPRLFDGQAELQKPPLYYWFVAAFAWLRGSPVDALAERLPAALAALATVLLFLFALGAQGRPVAGLLAALVLATAQHFTWIGRTGRIDVPLTFFVTAATLGLRSERVRWQIGGYLAIAAGILLKGPIGAVLPGAIVCVDRFGRPRPGSSSVWWGIPLVLGLTIPWFIAVHFRTGGEFTQQFFWYHHVLRATGGANTLATHPWWTYLVRLIVDPLPWSPLLIVAAAFIVRTRWLQVDSWARLGAIWLITVTALLSLSRFKRADYLLPAYPGLAILLGCLGERACFAVDSSCRARRLRWAVLSTCVTAVAIWAVLIHTVIAGLDSERSKQQFAVDIRAVAPAPEPILFFRVEDHLLGFHLGGSLNSFLEWENLDVWAGRPGAHFIVMPAECADAWRQYITSGTLEELTRFRDVTDRRRPRDLVLVRTHANGSIAHAIGPSAPHLARGDQRASAGIQPSGGIERDR
jgi:4-amino-4-deoxy-L-arabinose transferase-like glycosyltransferase